MTGGGVVNSTHMIAFQEKSNSSLLNKNKVTFERIAFVNYHRNKNASKIRLP